MLLSCGLIYVCTKENILFVNQKDVYIHNKKTKRMETGVEKIHEIFSLLQNLTQLPLTWRWNHNYVLLRQIKNPQCKHTGLLWKCGCQFRIHMRFYHDRNLIKSHLLLMLRPLSRKQTWLFVLLARLCSFLRTAAGYDKSTLNIHIIRCT